MLKSHILKVKLDEHETKKETRIIRGGKRIVL